MPGVLVAIPVAYGLLFVPRVLVIVALKQQRKFDNHNPRDALRALEGWGRRAQAAQENGYEAFPAFAAGVLACALTGARPELAIALCIIHLIARLAYVACYALDWAPLRSLVWFVGTGCTAGLMLLPAI